MTEYRPVVDAAALHVIVGANRAQRRALMEILQRLSYNPFQKGDFLEESPDTRPIHVKRFGRWQVRYWPDHGACEIRIVDFDRLSG